MANLVASRRYAKALYALSREQQAVEAVRADLAELVALLSSSPEWGLFVEAPVGSLDMRKGILNRLLGKQVHAITMKFLLFIDDKRRMSLLPSIYDAWLGLYDEEHGIVRATVLSAISLDNAQQEALTKRLSTRFDRKVILTAAVEPDLIGGLKILIGDHVIDISIQTQLEQLKKRMIYA